jgi:biopolymer transport protein ExbB/TolQ
MIDLYFQGGPLFMGLLSLIFLALLITSGLAFFKSNSADENEQPSKNPIPFAKLIRHIGLLALVLGVFGQLIGLYQAFDAIQEMGSVAPAMLAGGLKVSMISTLYGLLIYIISLLIWFVLKTLKKQHA